MAHSLTVEAKRSLIKTLELMGEDEEAEAIEEEIKRAGFDDKESS